MVDDPTTGTPDADSDPDDAEQPALGTGIDHDASAGEVSLDVSGTVGPDHLGQATATVQDHCYGPVDGVQQRGAESNPHTRRRTDTGAELPVLLETDLQTDPIEGTQGSYTRIVEGTCVRCGYDRLVETVHTLHGTRRRQCNACDAIQDARVDDGYRMPETTATRARRLRANNELLGTAFVVGEIYRVADDAVRLLDADGRQQYLPTRSVVEIVETMTRAGMLDLTEIDAVERLVDGLATALDADAQDLEYGVDRDSEYDVDTDPDCVEADPDDEESA